MKGSYAPGGVVIGITVAMSSLATIATAVRLFTRFCVARKPGFDDGAVASAWIMSWTLSAILILQVRDGLGQHFEDLSYREKTLSLCWVWMSTWIYYVALTFVKLSILIQYLRVFPHVMLRRCSWTLIAIVTVFGCWAFFSTIFACWPVESFWDPMAFEGPRACLNQKVVWFTNVAIIVVTDIIIVILPLPALANLSIPVKEKRVLLAVFGVGGLICVIAILRIPALVNVMSTGDVTHEEGFVAIWSSCEINAGIICSCAPTLKGFVGWLFPKDRGSRLSSDSSSSQKSKQPFWRRRRLRFLQHARPMSHGEEIVVETSVGQSVEMRHGLQRLPSHSDSLKQLFNSV